MINSLPLPDNPIVARDTAIGNLARIRAAELVKNLSLCQGLALKPIDLGLLHKQIAAELGLAKKTVKTHSQP